MDSYDPVDPMSNFHPLPYSYLENPSMFTTAPMPSMKQDIQQFHELPPALISSGSVPSIPSAPSSTVGSPYSGPSHTISSQDGFEHNGAQYGLGMMPTIVNNDAFSHDMMGSCMESELSLDKISDNYVDPSLIHASRSYGESAFSDQGLYPPTMHSYNNTSPSGSPAASPQPYGVFTSAHFSEPLTNTNYFHQPENMLRRRPSLISYESAISQPSPTSESGEEGREKGRCPHPECGRVFKDLKAHMLTHQAERPEKCPILTCEYNQKGFARKYDKNRHTLTHYKGTMVCGFCPGSGSPAEKSFNRADVFKRHLTSVHGVEQTAPNSRKRSPTANTRKLSSYCQDATGKCSTCSATFNNAQDFYEHLDDCVLRVVQQEEPSEAINAQHLSSMTMDNDVQETLDRHLIKTEDAPTSFDDDEEDDDDDDEDEDEEDDEDDDPSFNSRSGKGMIKTKAPASGRAIIGGGISKNTKTSKKSMTWSKGGVALVGKGRKKRKHYPPSWGMSADKMRMKKRVMCVYDGERRLWKDDMMLHNEFEVRMTLPDGKNYVTDLDVETLKRAEAFHNATREEKGPWMPLGGDDGQGFDLNALMA
ncbi:hypothetical protein LTR10_019673 [Elasticomyces elasticus]|uniref:C2H2-type domain-containing protein n=1 Tax=Exophiala sideris TaxID=1016849 RepID=A0ABR0IXF3_9EURO|nr:hypothetical protein LTR10_019673 [Elasticomyces elasticus]KAK5022083.1 hypothetical protein LTS07_010332 [Exophiala sideris]KAK5023567.1 hypothetical protein LTR13_011156 [Exophiala sideris]KAK5051207.1 hypothetical protein LTR69_010419 [Exophiala sideris]KAK5176238.1 hypothetical protein LTR44_011209 [Eurotiomycetes sp. CCFEE 6388]